MKGQVDVDELHNKVVCHLTSFSAAYGEENFIPKHHYCLHLSQGAHRHRALLSTFVHERRHKLIKRFATEIANAGAWFEKSVIIEGAAVHMNHLAGEDDDDLPTFLDDHRLKLVGAPRDISSQCEASLGNFLNVAVVGGATSKRAVLASGRMISEGDVVHVALRGVGHVATARLHVLVHGTLYSLVTIWDAGNDVNTFVQSEGNHVWTETRFVMGCYVYRWDSHDGNAHPVLVMFHGIQYDAALSRLLHLHSLLVACVCLTYRASRCPNDPACSFDVFDVRVLKS